MMFIIFDFIEDVKHEQQAGSQPYRQSKNINKREDFVFKQTSKRHFKIVFEHKECPRASLNLIRIMFKMIRRSANYSIVSLMLRIFPFELLILKPSLRTSNFALSSSHPA